MKILGVIPARYASSRLPGKPLADILGKPMIWWVYHAAKESPLLDELVVATDDERILAVCKEQGMNAVMTRADHDTPTARIQEVSCLIQADLYLQIMGDEPLIDPRAFELILPKDLPDDPYYVAGVTNRMDRPADVVDFSNQKVVCNARREILMISRSPIPFLRGVAREEWQQSHTYYKHIGLYAYRSDVLRAVTRLPQSTLEKAESLEQLRWIENGYRIRTAVTTLESHAIDTPEDLQNVLRLFAEEA